tara:strand:+ start:277 stop:558 length:282 start_codon:yes stop_codon:yes gene_type:complete
MTDLNLTPDEIRMLTMFHAKRDQGWIPLRNLTPEARLDVDMLVLSGLIERNRCDTADQWLNEWRLTEDATALLSEEMLFCEPNEPVSQTPMFT